MLFVQKSSLLFLSALLILATVTAEGAKKDKNDGPVTQSQLEKEVRHELVLLPYYGVFDNLAYQVNGSTVTLLGQVTRPTLKDDAGRVVKGIPGVEQVLAATEATLTVSGKLKMMF